MGPPLRAKVPGWRLATPERCAVGPVVALLVACLFAFGVVSVLCFPFSLSVVSPACIAFSASFVSRVAV